MNIKTLTVSSVLIALILLLAINIFSNTAFTSARIDLTDNKLFTLSQGSRNIVSNLDEPITVRFFLSQKLATRLPGISSYANRVKELLNEYKRSAGGNINLSIIDPEPFSEVEDQAVGYGLKGVPLNDGETTFYFGLVATGPTDEESVIAFFSPQREEFVEYDITKALQQVAHPKKKVVGLISTISIDGSPPPHRPGMPVIPRSNQAWTIVKQMQQFFEIKSLDPDIDKVPDDIDVLMLVHPKSLPVGTVYAIDQFVLNGGRLLAFVDPHAETDELSSQESSMPGKNFGSSDLNTLTEAWGITLTTDKVVGDIQLAQKVAFNIGQRNNAIDFPIWIKLPAEQLNGDDIITSEVGILNMATPGALQINAKEGVKITPLISTTNNATQINKSQLGFLTDPQNLLRNYKPSGISYTLAARITGNVKSAFPDGAPKPPTAHDHAPQQEEEEDNSNTESSQQHLTESSMPINVIMVADTDMLEDRFWVRVQNLFGSRVAVPMAANGSFVINALDNLMGSNDLISVRNRGHFSRPFTTVDEIRQEAELKFREKEQELMNRLRETERKLVDLQSGKDQDKALILSPEQKVALERFRHERVRIRKELRQVRHQLQQNIDNLEGWIKFINIGLIPLIIAVIGIIIGIMSLRKRNITSRSSAAIS
ncbi:MAG: ABC transporter [Gammaproteobacteria bacterium]|nr:ABC transporter [Gammaproteobacteria bacterium]